MGHSGKQINLKNILGINKDDLKELGDRIIQAFKDIQEKRKQITQKTSEEILKTELENLKALADRQIANEKTVLDLKLANAKKSGDRVKLKTDEAQKEYEAQLGVNCQYLNVFNVPSSSLLEL